MDINRKSTGIIGYWAMGQKQYNYRYQLGNMTKQLSFVEKI